MRTPQRRVPLSPHNCAPLVPGEEVVLRGGILAVTHLYNIRPELLLACEKLPEMLIVLQRFDWYLAQDNHIIGQLGMMWKWMLNSHYHLRWGAHSRSLQVQQVDPSPAFAMPPFNRQVFSSLVLVFPILPSACVGSLKDPRDLTSLPLDIFLFNFCFSCTGCRGLTFSWILGRLGW